MKDDFINFLHFSLQMLELTVFFMQGSSCSRSSRGCFLFLPAGKEKQLRGSSQTAIDRAEMVVSEFLFLFPDILIDDGVLSTCNLPPPLIVFPVLSFCKQPSLVVNK